MPTHTEQLNETDKKIINSNRRRDMIIISAIVVIGALVINLLYNDYISRGSNGAWAIVQDIGIIILIFLYTLKLFRRLGKGKVDLQQGIKQVCTGSVQRKMGGGYSRKLNYYFYIDEQKIKVPGKIWKQYKDNDILKVEYVPKSKYILSASKQEN